MNEYLTHRTALSRVNLNMTDLLGLAWLAEMAGLYRQSIGDKVWSKKLFEDAQALRAQAVNR